VGEFTAESSFLTSLTPLTLTGYVVSIALSTFEDDCVIVAVGVLLGGMDGLLNGNEPWEEAEDQICFLDVEVDVG